jgi:hypothetical protein
MLIFAVRLQHDPLETREIFGAGRVAIDERRVRGRRLDPS